MLLKIVAFVCFISFCRTEDNVKGIKSVHIQGNCTPAAINEFPNDGFTREQRRSGWIAVHVILTIYCFIALCIVCDERFVPAIQNLVESLHLSDDVAGASFMAITSSSPELFINCIGTFITEGDIGVGTVVGSNVFNVLAAPSLCGLFANSAFTFEWWSITRDGLIYIIGVIMLIAILYDDRVYWYEALSLVLLYAFYIAVMYFSKHIKKILYKCNGQYVEVVTPNEKLQLSPINEAFEEKFKKDEDNHVVAYWKVIFCPMRYTIPKSKKLYWLSLLMCIVWIGTLSYILAWLITAIGDTINIPDSIMGLCFLAIGSSMPEIVTVIIISRQGRGVMGMSSALGASTFEVQLCLGLPWLIKTCLYNGTTGKSWIKINSSGLTYDATYLLSSILFFSICLIFNKLRIDKKIGVLCLMVYVIFLIVGSLIELNVFFPVNLPTCR